MAWLGRWSSCWVNRAYSHGGGIQLLADRVDDGRIGKAGSHTGGKIRHRLGEGIDFGANVLDGHREKFLEGVEVVVHNRELLENPFLKCSRTRYFGRDVMRKHRHYQSTEILRSDKILIHGY